LSPECYSNIFLQEAGYDYLGQMKLYSEDDKKSIYWSLRRIFDFDDSQINQAILYQAGIQDSSRYVSWWIIARTFTALPFYCVFGTGSFPGVLLRD
jgi:hypothetical protein